MKAAKQAGPGLVVVGDTVAQRDKLSWFETKPLFGWRVLVPRTREQAGALSQQLTRFGAVGVEVPTISVEPPRTPQQMERAITGLVSGRFQWVVFTSANAVKAVREKFEEYGLDARAFAGLKVAAVGDQTAASLVAFGVRPDLVPSGEQSSVGLLEDFPEFDPIFDPINRVFLPRADIATDTLVAGLVELGWEIEDVTAYRTVRAAPPAAETREAIKTGGFDAVLFTSSSTVRNLVGIAGKPHASTVVACIGPQTAKTAGGARPAGRRPRRDAVGRRARRRARRARRRPAPRRPRAGRAGVASEQAPWCGPSQGDLIVGFPVERPRRLRRTPALDAPAGRRDAAAPRRAGAAAVRARGPRRAAADRVDARCGAAHAASRCGQPPRRRRTSASGA